MSQNHSVEVIVKDDGTVTIEVNGIAGPGCAELEIVRELQELGQETERRRKPEYRRGQPLTRKDRVKAR